MPSSTVTTPSIHSTSSEPPVTNQSSDGTTTQVQKPVDPSIYIFVGLGVIIILLLAMIVRGHMRQRATAQSMRQQKQLKRELEPIDRPSKGISLAKAYKIKETRLKREDSSLPVLLEMPPKTYGTSPDGSINGSLEPSL